MNKKQKTMVKELIAVAIFLLIQNALKTIYCVYAIFDLIVLIQYVFYNNKIFFQIDYSLYKFDKIKIIFDDYYLINIKIFQITFNYLKSHTLKYFV